MYMYMYGLCSCTKNVRVCMKRTLCVVSESSNWDAMVKHTSWSLTCVYTCVGCTKQQTCMYKVHVVLVTCYTCWKLHVLYGERWRAFCVATVITSELVVLYLALSAELFEEFLGLDSRSMQQELGEG